MKEEREGERSKKVKREGRKDKGKGGQSSPSLLPRLTFSVHCSFCAFSSITEDLILYGKKGR